jgi:hypothetical protein
MTEKENAQVAFVMLNLFAFIIKNESKKKRHVMLLRTEKHVPYSILKSEEKAQSARIRLFLGLCSTSAIPKASKIGGI